MHVRAEQQDEAQVVPLTQQHVFRAHQMDKIEMLARLLQAHGRGLTMVFCRTKRTADQVAAALATRGFAAAAVHGDLGQGQRERALRAFRNGKIDVLVATEVAARGLDVDDVTHVVNYECPEDDKAYLHRIGRTGRAGRSGVAVTFVDWRDMQRWKLINEALGLGLAEPPETYSTSEHFHSELDIPPGATGNLPRAQRGRQGLEAEDLEDLGETGRIRSAAGRRLGARGTAVREDAVREAAPRKPRVRKRTRGGVSATAEQTKLATEHGATEHGATEHGAKENGAKESARTQPTARRRRRSRGGRKGPVPGQV
jgi:superfamily II DNA/RNA helicase